MASEKTDALVLRVVDFSETSCIATLFTRDFGKVSVLAKGARRPKSPFEAALDLLALCRVVFLRKSSEGLDLLTEAKLERRFRSASRNLSRLYAGFYVVELLRDLTDTHDPHPELFQAAEQSLTAIDEGAALAETVLHFEMAMLFELGHMPSLDLCVGCGQEVEAVGRVSFGLEAGGVLCKTCRSGRRQVISASANAITLLRQCADTEQSETEQRKIVQLDRAASGELRSILNQYLTHLLGHRPKMHQYSRMWAN